MPSCPCLVRWRESDRSRLIQSTGARYTVQGLPTVGPEWLFRYLYLPPDCDYYSPHR